MIVQFIKGVTCTIHNGKSLFVKELSEMLGNNSQMEDAKKILDAPCHKIVGMLS